MVVLGFRDIEKRYGGLPALGARRPAGDRSRHRPHSSSRKAGKSTLLKTVSGMEAQRGAIHYLGADITRLERHRIRRAGIAMVQQTPRLFESMTIRANVVVGAMFGGTGGRLSEEGRVAAGRRSARLRWACPSPAITSTHSTSMRNAS